MTLTLTAVNDPSEPPRVRVDVASTAAGPLPVPNNSMVQVFRTHPDGSVHRVLSVANDRLIGGAATVFDYAPPFNIPLSYSARAASQTSASVTAWVPVTDQAWLVHPSDPSLSVRCAYVDGLGDPKLAARVGVYEVHNSRYPVTRSAGRRSAPEQTLTVGVTPEQLPALTNDVGTGLLDDSGAILVNLPPQAGWDVTWRWVQPLDVSIHNPGSNDAWGGSAGYPYRILSIPYRVVGDPTADIVPVWTIADEVAEFATITAAMAAFATCGGQATNTRGA